MLKVIQSLPLNAKSRIDRDERDTGDMTPSEITAWLQRRDRQRLQLQRINYLVNAALGAALVLYGYLGAKLLHLI